MSLSHRIHRRFKFTVVNIKDSCYLASSWIYTTKEELFSTYFTEGTTRMIGVILCVNSWISKHCPQYRSDFQHQHLFFCSVQFGSVQSLGRVRLFATPIEPQHTRPPCPSPTLRVYPNSWPLGRWCHLTISSAVVPFSSCLQSFPTSGFFQMSQLSKNWSFSFNISPSDEHPERISFRMDWLDLLAVQGTLKSLLQYHSSKASILLRSAFFIVHLYIPDEVQGKLWCSTALEGVRMEWRSTVGSLLVTTMPWVCGPHPSAPPTGCRSMGTQERMNWAFLGAMATAESTTGTSHPSPTGTPTRAARVCPALGALAVLSQPQWWPPRAQMAIRVFSNESALRIRWPKYWSLSFNISPSNEHPGLISFRMDWLDLLSVQGTLKSLFQHYSPKASILWHSAFFIVQLSHPYMTTGKTTALTRWPLLTK